VSGGNEGGKHLADDGDVTACTFSGAAGRFVDSVDNNDDGLPFASQRREKPPRAGRLVRPAGFAETAHQFLGSEATGVDEPRDAAQIRNRGRRQGMQPRNSAPEPSVSENGQPGQESRLARAGVAGHHECRRTSTGAKPLAEVPESGPPAGEEPQVLGRRVDDVKTLRTRQDVMALVGRSGCSLSVQGLGAQVEVAKPPVEAWIGEEGGDRVAGEEEPGVLPVRGLLVDEGDDAVEGEVLRLVAAAGAMVDGCDQRVAEGTQQPSRWGGRRPRPTEGCS
jgi:hypothetical protein